MSHGGSSTGREPQRFQKTVSIRDLLCLAEMVVLRTKNEVVMMPETVGFCFREAIAARTHLSGFFRNTGGNRGAAVVGTDDLETANHEFFTAR